MAQDTLYQRLDKERALSTWRISIANVRTQLDIAKQAIVEYIHDHQDEYENMTADVYGLRVPMRVLYVYSYERGVFFCPATRRFYTQVETDRFENELLLSSISAQKEDELIGSRDFVKAVLKLKD